MDTRKASEPPASPGLVLAFETATALGGVAIVDGAGRLLAETTFLGRESHSERIVLEAARLLEALGAGPADLAAVAVSSGPGSFTGLRTGVAAAKGLAFARGVPLHGVPTLEALAAGTPPGCGTVCAVVRAGRGELYRALFDAAGPRPVRLTDDELVAAGGFGATLPPGCLVLGEVPADAGLPPGIRRAAGQLDHPRAAAVALLGLEALREARPSGVADLVPRYVRPPGAAFRGWCAPGKAAQ